ncbi:MAG: MFS transporter [Proteobacteria bacterium]|nr:MFS transporter [Pseudomonadota bacterium]
MKSTASPFTIPNIQLFIAFRVFFNARFYYPVFTILFLDYGLTIEQFALLNTVWAITIVCAEVPSGALADILGRKYLLVTTSLLMVAEMSLLAFVPLGNSTVIFSVFLINRVMSGLAEALASGADEAIAYDSLVEEGNAEDWPKVLSVQMRLRSIASILTMTIGALVYDPSVINRVLFWIGSDLNVTQQVTMRFPIYLTFILSLLATACAWKIREKHAPQIAGQGSTSLAALRKTLQAGAWLARTPFALAIILFGTLYDHVLRMIVTMTSQYFRQIDLPEASFGLIGSAMAVLGLVTPKVAEWMVAKNSPAANVWWVSGISLLGLFGLTGFFPYWGLLPMACIFTALMLVSFFTSHYLNRITESHQRATVLSFKGLAFNLAYGTIGFLFALLISRLRDGGKAGHPGWSEAAIENFAFQEAIGWFPWYAAVGLALTIIFCLYRLRGTEDHRKIG